MTQHIPTGAAAEPIDQVLELMRLHHDAIHFAIKADRGDGSTAELFATNEALETAIRAALAHPAATAACAPKISTVDEFFAAAEAAGITHWTPAMTEAVAKRSDEIAAGVAPTLTDEQIELAAKAIFEHWAFAAPVAWVDGGNSDMQDRARRFARAALAATRAEPAGGRDEREEFERWARGKGFAAQRTLPTDAVYSDSSSHIMWEAWQARASLAAPPQPTSEASRDL